MKTDNNIHLLPEFRIIDKIFFPRLNEDTSEGEVATKICYHYWNDIVKKNKYSEFVEWFKKEYPDKYMDMF